MENLDTVRARFQEACNAYAITSGAASHYYEGVMTGIVDAVAAMLGISWIEADVLLRKTKD
jgi:hypothetical protein